MTEQREIDEETGTETTGHEWDGIKELDNPLPRWWLWIFYASVAWSVVYWILMPAWPALPGFQGFTPGVVGNSERVNVARAMDDLQSSRGDFYARLEGADIATIRGDDELFGFALAAGRSAFGDNCATCHGSGGQGATGYPNLNDDVWLWGGTYEAIHTTLRYGIRAEHPDTRFSQMPAFGRDELLTREQIRETADYVISLSTAQPMAASSPGRQIFAQQCASCHGAGGEGDRAQGAPDLTDQEWLYGGSREAVILSIHRGPYGVMPAWEGRLDDATIAALATYVFSLGGGEEAEAVVEGNTAGGQ
ncbi:cytochrome-c oxidase, cbb3-type subunit III [Hyphobacterium marinum]|uniref:Cbb3-type cytochrome c oxidase subunit n=1 Tax=Hyphobacterium marinum TaxID=3116574 RepID=A0ABU7LV77_9PROT|nr:cytochrome-c oxidase, cbb3-type subunit III [Hyphobacterium sp. Y6023]MEE2565075.1 cytochrome-c oxidase, cbb3-type subunit III [Hyphobacterium sp. Y6023]